MIKYLSYTIELKKLAQEKAKLSKELDHLSKNQNGYDEDGQLSYLYQQLEELDSWIEHQKTAYLKSKADRLLVPMPDVSESKFYTTYEFGDDTVNILTLKGQHRVRNLIREEQKAKREIVGFWITIITGLIGSVIGLISVLKS